MNLIVLTAALFSANSGLYSAGRMLRALADRGETPASAIGEDTATPVCLLPLRKVEVAMTFPSHSSRASRPDAEPPRRVLVLSEGV